MVNLCLDIGPQSSATVKSKVLTVSVVMSEYNHARASAGK